MPAITIRNISGETHRALRARAAEHSRSTEAEIRAILDDAVKPADRVKLGTALVDLFRPFGGVELDSVRDQEEPKAASFD